MNCQDVSDRLSEFFDGELSAALAERIQSHVGACEACACELRSFSAMGDWISRTAAATGTPSVKDRSWEEIANRLDARQFPLSNSVAPAVAPARANSAARPWRGRIAIVAALALAGSILFVLAPWYLSRLGEVDLRRSSADGSLAAVAIDYEELLESGAQAGQPAIAFQTLSDKFNGQEITAGETKEILGYQPSIARALPAGAQVISTRVLQLPHCNCQVGQCTCGPGGCNCAASLCQRADGSEFVVVEHCATQSISFGGMEARLVKTDKNEFEFLQSRKHLAATWLVGERRLTAIGLASEEEAKSIISHLAM